MIPMRDGIELYTVIVIPKTATNAPILLTRTPYNAAARATRSESPYMIDGLPTGDDVFVRAGYIRVFQDERGKYGSEGAYLMTPPPIGPLNSSGIDDTTDAYDTIDWLVTNIHESNGKVGMSEVGEKSLRTTLASESHSNATAGNRNREAFTKETPRIHFSRAVAASYKR
jgi:putative CocE/NonD family hydrolase